MLTVTEGAKKYLKSLLLTRTKDSELSLRLEGEPGQFRIKLDRKIPGDQVFEYEGTKVLLIDPVLALLLEEANLDVLDTPDDPKLVVLGIE
jgi:Fe-S cluster assembly iron-binding protein IscA